MARSADAIAKTTTSSVELVTLANQVLSTASQMTRTGFLPQYTRPSNLRSSLTVSAQYAAGRCHRAAGRTSACAPSSDGLARTRATRLCRRGAKTSVTVKADDLPQGGLSLEPLQRDLDAPATYPTVVQQARNNMNKFDKCVLLTRVGSFYEACLIVLSPTESKLTSRSCTLNRPSTTGHSST